MVLSNVKAEMSRHNYSIEDLANMLGVSWATAHSWINGKTKIPADGIKRIAELFGVTTDYLLDMKTDRK